MIIFDTETTGLPSPGLVPLKAQPRIIEFAAVRLDDKTLEEKPTDIPCFTCGGKGTVPDGEEPALINHKCSICRGLGKKTAALNFLIHPGIEITPKITEITGITNEMLKGQKPFSFFYGLLCRFFLGEMIICGHNLDFDKKLLAFDLQRIGCEFSFPWPPRGICTVEESYRIKGHRLKLTDLYSMATNGGSIQGAHRAINDVRATATSLRYLRDNGHVKI